MPPGFALWLSPRILGTVSRVLEDLFKWERPQAGAPVAVITQAAGHGGGGLLAAVPRTAHDCPGHEDNLVLDLAAEAGAMLIVSGDTDLPSVSPWRGTPILNPVAFAAKVDAMRRHARRKAALRQKYDREFAGAQPQQAH